MELAHRPANATALTAPQRDISTRSRVEFAVSRFLDHVFHIKRDGRALEARMTDELAAFGPGRRLPVDVVEDLAPEVFFEKYYRTSTPVLMKGLARAWPCVQKWSPSFFKHEYGTQPVSVMDNDNTGGVFNFENMSIGEFMDSVDRGDTKKHLRFGNILHRFPELVDDFDTETLGRYMTSVQIAKNFGAFIGAKGTQTRLHAEPFENLFTQVYGVKRWVLVKPRFDAALRPPMTRSPYFWTEFDPDLPDYEKYPAMKYIDMYEVECHAGDVLYNPGSSWHQVTNLTATIGVGRKWVSPMCARHNFSQLALFFMATNPSLLTMVRNKKEYTKVFEAAERAHRQYFATADAP